MQIIGLFIVIFFVVFAFQSCSGESEESAAKRESDRIAGFHCLSVWNGSHSGVVAQIKDVLRDPRSFEHIETRITPVDNSGGHTLYMSYRARNGFGGMDSGTVVANVRNSNCQATLVSHD